MAKEIVIEVIVTVVGVQVSFPVLWMRKRVGGVGYEDGAVCSGAEGDIQREASLERRYRCRRRLAVAGGTRLAGDYLQEQRGRASIVRGVGGGGGISTRASQNAGFTCFSLIRTSHLTQLFH